MIYMYFVVIILIVCNCKYWIVFINSRIYVWANSAAL